MGIYDKIDTETFIEKAREVHGDYYDYSKTKYTKQGCKVTITCPAHGDFTSGYHHISQRSRCKQCAREIIQSNSLGQRFSDFIKKATEKHGDRYDYSKVRYTTARSKVTIICPDHGEWEQVPDSHLRGCGCPRCGRKKAESKKWQDLTNMRFGRLTVVAFSHFEMQERENRENPQRTGYWHCTCECGTPVTIQTSSLKGGVTKSCGCLRSEVTAMRNLAFAVEGLSDPLIASMPTCLYFVEVEGYFQKFGTTTESVEVRGKKGGGENYYTKIYWQKWMPRSVALPVEQVLLEESIGFFSAIEAVRKGLRDWGGWTETRVGLTIEEWMHRCQLLVKECQELGYQKFLAKRATRC